MCRSSFTVLLAWSFVCCAALHAQKVYTSSDYHAAEAWMPYNTQPLIHHALSGFQYLPDGRVFYRDPAAASVTYYLADAAHGTRATAFDSARVAAALGAASHTPVDAATLRVSDFKLDAQGFSVRAEGRTFDCDAQGTTCREQAQPDLPAGHAPLNVSPDGRYGLFIRDWNLWVRTMATGEERQLTQDGQTDFGYATDNAGWQHSDHAIATWAPDGRTVATFQQDQRKDGMMYLVSADVGHPTLEAWRYPFVGDKDVTMIEPVIVNVATGAMVRLKTPPLQHRSMECDDVSCDGDHRWQDAWFGPDGKTLAFVSTSRDHKDEWLKVADAGTGAVREVFHVHVPTYYGWQSRTNFKYLPGSNEFLWVSERSNDAQIYLYALATGRLKNQVTHGDGPVQDISFVDAKARVVYFLAAGKQSGVDPYFEQLYSVHFDGTDQKLLTPEAAEHEIVEAPDGATFVDTYSTVREPATTVIRSRAGRVLEKLGTEDIAALVAAGWKPALPIRVKARDGKTDLYGFAVRPFHMEPGRKYPIIDYVYPGPQIGSCGGSAGRTFARANLSADLALAQLGFVVICIDGQGTPGRSKSFHDAHADTPIDMNDGTIPDQIAGLRDLATQYPWINLSHVGIWGHSGGGNATVSAMFHDPQFFEVGWAESGNHDSRVYEDDWDERWAGLDTGANVAGYAAQANWNYAKNLEGKLMLVHGTMDNNVPPANTLLVVQALMRANRDFDMLMVPNARHGYGEMTPYIMRRRWDYFVRWLAGGTPPKDYAMMPYDEQLRRYRASR